MPEPRPSIRVLIVGPASEDLEAIMNVQWLHVETESEYIAQLAWPDVILASCDLASRALAAPRALDVLRQHQWDTPFIVLSEAADEPEALAMLDRGATDYLVKGHLARLGYALKRAAAESKLRDAFAGPDRRCARATSDSVPL
jgi:CheY-like chemotaxis protein